VPGDHGLVYKATADAVTGNAMVLRMRQAWDSTISAAPVSYWRPDSSVATSSTSPNYLLLEAVPQLTWPVSDPVTEGLENPNNQQILIEGRTDRIYVTYAPNGGINASNYTTPWTPGFTIGFPTILTSGRRNLGGGPTDVAHVTSANFNGSFYIVEYRDQSIVTDFPFSSLLLMFESGTNTFSPWRYACHAGRILTPTNHNDPYVVGGPTITGDAVLLGVASATNSANTQWLFKETASSAFRSCVRIGNSWSVIESETIPAGTQLGDINGVIRLVPYDINVNSVVGGGRVGKTKYLRQYKNNFGRITPTLLTSSNSASQQAWAGWKDPSADANFHNQCILWNKNVTYVS
jgi:hypothetical protein